MGKLTGKKAIVTGASRGIGLAIATKLASEGADVAILSTSVKEELAAKLSAELGVQVKSYACNVADSETDGLQADYRGHGHGRHPGQQRGHYP